MKIFFEEEQQVSKEILETMEKAFGRCLTLLGIDEGRSEISVTFVGRGDSLPEQGLQKDGQGY